jgi:hypothetical protein
MISARRQAPVPVILSEEGMVAKHAQKAAASRRTPRRGCAALRNAYALALPAIDPFFTLATCAIRSTMRFE